MEKLEYIPGDLVKFATNTYTIVNFEENFLQHKICYALISTNSTNQLSLQTEIFYRFLSFLIF